MSTELHRGLIRRMADVDELGDNAAGNRAEAGLWPPQRIGPPPQECLAPLLPACLSYRRLSPSPQIQIRPIKAGILPDLS